MNDQAEPLEELIELYEAGPNCLEEVVSKLSEKDLNLSLSAGTWTIREYIHHLADGEDIWKMILKQALGAPGGSTSLEWYVQFPQDRWAENWQYAHRPIAPSLALFRASRAHVAQLLRQIPGAFEKSLLMHQPDGQEESISVRWMVEMETRHLDGHIHDIQRIIGLHYQRTTPI